MKSNYRQKLLLIAFTTLAFFVFGLAFLFLQAADAATINVSWSYTPEEQAKINKFRIYDQNHAVIVDDIPAADRTATFDIEDECGGGYIVSAAGTGEKEIESEPSNIIGWRPPAPEKPPVPAVFSVSGTLRLEAVR